MIFKEILSTTFEEESAQFMSLRHKFQEVYSRQCENQRSFQLLFGMNFKEVQTSFHTENEADFSTVFKVYFGHNFGGVGQR